MSPTRALATIRWIFHRREHLSRPAASPAPGPAAWPAPARRRAAPLQFPADPQVRELRGPQTAAVIPGHFCAPPPYAPALGKLSEIFRPRLL